MTPRNLRRLAAKVEFILGSGSPRRWELLKETGISFRRLVPYVEETIDPDESPFHSAQRLAEQKALTVSGRVGTGAVVLGCDTIVILGKQILQKPKNEPEAFEILMCLSGRQHVVCTALALASGKEVLASGSELTRVFFNQVSSQQINDYIATGEPMDKAGAYGIQGMGAFLVDRIEGNLDNVIGLPRTLLGQLAGKTLRKLEDAGEQQ